MKSIKLPQYLYTASLFLLIFLTAVCVAISAADVIIQALTDKTNDGKFDYRNLIVVGGSYVLLALGALLFSCSRMLTVRASLQDIPKLYIPIKLEDLPKKVFLKIRNEFEEAKKTRKLAEPRPEDIQAVGWAKPGTPLFEGLDFKQAIAKTPGLLEQIATSISPAYARPLYVPVRQYVEFLMQEKLIDRQLGTFYLDGYTIARFSKDPLSQEQYMDIMKHLAAILQNMGYSLKGGNSTNGGGYQTANDSPSAANGGESSSSNTTTPSISRRKSSFAGKRRASSHKSIKSRHSFLESSDNLSMRGTQESIRTNNSRTTSSSQHRSQVQQQALGPPPVPELLLQPDLLDSETIENIIMSGGGLLSVPSENEEDDGSVYDEDEVRNGIYQLLMKDKVPSSSQQQH